MYALYMQDHGACWYAGYGIKMLSLPSSTDRIIQDTKHLLKF